MAQEIEHKYLVTSDDYKNCSVVSHKIIQGYLSKDPERIVRIRIKDNRGFLTIKGKTEIDTRYEFEYEIPLEDAKRMLSLCLGTPIEKTRWIVNHEGYKWEVDEFTSPCNMVIAEIE
ncbi:MAG: CYTH domain-containing protein, partial [Muribaculaceae bacterium]|nr:CYTH domain-containing protein [Muribaculaceae bacterium]